MNNINMVPLDPRPNDDTSVGEYPWQVKPIAFRIAAGFLIANTILSLITLFLGMTPNIISIVIDIILAITLLALQPNARGFTLFRSYAGAILLPILAFTQYSLSAAFITTIIQWAYSGSLILLLQGETKNWKIYTAIGIFVVLVFGATSILLLLALLAKMIR